MLHSSTQSPHIITLFVKDYPTTFSQTQPDVKVQTNSDGIYFSYFGYVAATGIDGQVVFPRRHQKPSFTLIVTTDAQPVFMASNTIAFWQLHKNADYACYSIVKTQDAETKKWLWQVKKVSPPKNTELPVETIIVFANPEALYVPEGVTLSDSNQQLVLPPMYATQKIERPTASFKLLEVRNFFQSLGTTYKKEKIDVQSQVQ